MYPMPASTAPATASATMMTMGDLAGAAEAYSEALRLYPQYADARYNLGILLKEQGRPE